MTDNNKRVETGVLQFGDDWPCVVIRGDNAMYYAAMLRQVADNPELAEGVMVKAMLEGLADLLGECRVTPNGEPKEVQYLKSFDKTLK